jgi:uncharacterized protein (TIGR02246 family)
MNGFKKNSLLALLVVVCFGLPATLAKAQNQSISDGGKTTESAKLKEARKAIDDGNNQWIEAWAKGDPEQVIATFAKNGMQLRPDGSIVKGHEKIRELVAASMKRLGPGVVLTVTTTTVWLDGNTAYETGKSVYKYTQNGEAKTFEARYVSIWKRQRKGRWELLMDMGVPQN